MWLDISVWLCHISQKNYTKCVYALERIFKPLDETKATIEATLNANNGVMSWDTMMGAIPFENRRYVVPALRQLQAEGKAKRQVRSDPDNNAVFEIVRIVS